MKKLVLLPILLLLSTSLLAQSSKQVEILEPYARAVTAGQKNSAVFMQLSNSSNQERKIVSASSNVSKVVELHTHINDSGVMRMRRIDEIAIPAMGTTELKPGGLHIMLIDLHGALNEGEKVELEIEFADGSKSEIIAPIQKVMRMKHHGKHGKKGHNDKGGKNKHHAKGANPMPNLMKVIKQQGKKLGLSDQQESALEQWRKANHDKVHGLMKKVQQLENELNKASLSGEEKSRIMAKADELMDVRKAIIETKTDCRDNLKTVLTASQYSQVIETYGTMDSSKMHHRGKKMHQSKLE